MESLVGRRLGSYRLVRLLGLGSFGGVFEAHEEGKGRMVALKVLKAEMTQNERVVKRFGRESRILAKLDHPGAPRVYEAGEAEGFLFMALELVPGRTLGAELREIGAFALPRSLEIARQVLDVLDVAHGLTIVHRDLKPENVMIFSAADGAERAKVLDFGLAKIVEVETSGLTGRATMVGTPQYMAPEQLDSAADAGPAADVYAVGEILYELLTGEPAFDDFTLRGLALKKLTKPPPSVRLLRPDLPATLETILTQALAIRVEDRIPSARAFAIALEAVKDEPPGGLRARPRLEGTRRGRLRASGTKAALAPTIDGPVGAGEHAGRTLGLYRLDRLLAKTRSGDVYEAFDTGFERAVAVKVRGGPDALRHLRAEALLLARVGAPAAFDVVATDESDGLAYLVLLGVSGRLLSDVLRESGRFPLERAALCALALLETLESLHALGFVHRDVAPTNVLVSVAEGSEAFRLLDWSLAASPDSPGQPAAPFASPEQAALVALDGTSDLYSVAALVRALMGEPVPPSLAPVLERALARDPAARFPDAQALGRALETAAASSSRILEAAGRKALTESTTGEARVTLEPSLLGQRLGRYRVEALLGKDSLGDVYRATQLDLRRPVAFRVLAPELAQDKDLLKAMIRGAREAARVTHVAFAQVHEIGSSAPRFLATQLVPGRTLAMRLREGALAIDRAKAIALRLLEALAAAHAREVVHGALEPSVLVLPPDDSDVRVLELGLGTLRARAGKLASARAYFPPERSSTDGDAASPGHDVYAVGLMLHEMLSGAQPSVLPRSTRVLRPQVSCELDRVVLKAIAPRSADRFPDAASFAAALGAAAP